MTDRLELETLEETFAVCRLDPAGPLPEWARGRELLATVATPEELSVVCAEARVPAGIESSGGWRALRVAGRLAHSLTGVLASLTAPLAEAEIPIFAISSYDTDYLLVPAARLDAAGRALEAAGHHVL